MISVDSVETRSTDDIIKRAPPVDDCITAEDGPDLPLPPPDMLEGLEAEREPLTPSRQPPTSEPVTTDDEIPMI